MISVTTPTVENGVIVEYKGIVTGQVVNGVNFIKNFGASIRNIVGVNIDYEVLGQGNMLMVSATGTAVVVQNK